MTDADRKAAERTRKRLAGLVPVEVWVPRKMADEIRRIAKAMRDENSAQEPRD